MSSFLSTLLLHNAMETGKDLWCSPACANVFRCILFSCAQVGRASEEEDTEMENLMQNKQNVLRTLPGVNPEKALHNLEQMSQSVLEQKDEKNSKDKRDEISVSVAGVSE